MKPVSLTHLENLHRWRRQTQLDLEPDRQHARWLAPLLPTNRFGPSGWISFSMVKLPGDTMSGDFCAWILYANDDVRLLAYLERPIADTFGVVGRFELSTPIAPDPVVSALGRLGAALFDGTSADAADVAAVATYWTTLTDGTRDALRTAAPDFLQWAGLERATT